MLGFSPLSSAPIAGLQNVSLSANAFETGAVDVSVSTAYLSTPLFGNNVEAGAVSLPSVVFNQNHPLEAVYTSSASTSVPSTGITQHQIFAAQNDLIMYSPEVLNTSVTQDHVFGAVAVSSGAVSIPTLRRKWMDGYVDAETWTDAVTPTEIWSETSLGGGTWAGSSSSNKNWSEQAASLSQTWTQAA